MSLTNKVNFESPDMAPITIMEHIVHLSTQINEVYTKAEGLIISSQIKGVYNGMVRGWIVSNRSDLISITQNCVNTVYTAVFTQLLPIVYFFPIIGVECVSYSLSVGGTAPKF